MKKEEKRTYPVLHLNLKRKWYDMILNGEKREEYREITPYWARFFVNGKIKIKGKLYDPEKVVICFSNGYQKNRRQSEFTCVGLRIGTGREAWGAEPGKQYFVLKLGCHLLF